MEDSGLRTLTCNCIQYCRLWVARKETSGWADDLMAAHRLPSLGTSCPAAALRWIWSTRCPRDSRGRRCLWSWWKPSLHTLRSPVLTTAVLNVLVSQNSNCLNFRNCILILYARTCIVIHQYPRPDNKISSNHPPPTDGEGEGGLVFAIYLQYSEERFVL